MTLDARMLVGRSRKCDLVLAHGSISGEHAVIWWARNRWLIRDLGSRNGTRVAGKTLALETPMQLEQGMELRFGHHPVPWEVSGVGPPLVRAVGADGAVVEERNGLMILPNVTNPEALVYEDPRMGWVMEAGSETRQVQDLDLLTVGGQPWRIHLPGQLDSTIDEGQSMVSLSQVELEFVVSSDEEHVTLFAHTPHTVLDMQSRAHHYALLTLARARIEDAKDPEVPAAGHGWLYQEDLADMLRLERTQLNLLIYRARKQLAAFNVPDAHDLVERRRDTNQIRLGVGAIRVTTA
jgi:hypothetical protein